MRRAHRLMTIFTSSVRLPLNPTRRFASDVLGPESTVYINQKDQQTLLLPFQSGDDPPRFRGGPVVPKKKSKTTPPDAIPFSVDTQVKLFMMLFVDLQVQCRFRFRHRVGSRAWTSKPQSSRILVLSPMFRLTNDLYIAVVIRPDGRIARTNCPDELPERVSWTERLRLVRLC